MSNGPLTDEMRQLLSGAIGEPSTPGAPQTMTPLPGLDRLAPPPALGQIRPDPLIGTAMAGGAINPPPFASASAANFFGPRTEFGSQSMVGNQTGSIGPQPGNDLIGNIKLNKLGMQGLL